MIIQLRVEDIFMSGITQILLVIIQSPPRRNEVLTSNIRQSSHKGDFDSLCISPYLFAISLPLLGSLSISLCPLCLLPFCLYSLVYFSSQPEQGKPPFPTADRRTARSYVHSEWVSEWVGGREREREKKFHCGVGCKFDGLYLIQCPVIRIVTDWILYPKDWLEHIAFM